MKPFYSTFTGAKYYSVTAALALLLPMLAPCAFGATATIPEGVISLKLQQGATTAVGFPLLDANVFRGVASVVSPNSLSIAGRPWTAGQFARAGDPWWVKILSGAETGRTLRITWNTADSLNLSVDDTNLQSSGFAVLVGDSFEIFRGDTLGSLFGQTTGALLLQGGTSTLNADTVQVYTTHGYVSYYFDTVRGSWVRPDVAGTRQNDLVLPPEGGMLVTRRGPTTYLSATGRAPATALLTRLPAGTTTPLAVRYPVDTTLGAWKYSGPGTWIANDSVVWADRISLFDGLGWNAYWKRAADGQWRKQNGDTIDQAGIVIPAGSSVLIQKIGHGVGPASFFRQTLPYNVHP